MDENTTATTTVSARGAFLRRALLPWLLATLELAVAAAVSMLIVDMVSSAAIRWLGVMWVLGHPLGIALVMTLDVWVGTALWMLIRGRSPRAILAVLLSIAAGFLAPLPLFWASVLTASETVQLGHLLVIPAIAIAVALLRSGRGARRVPRVRA